MEQLATLTLSSDNWRVFRDLRLAALREAPDAFGSRYEDWVELISLWVAPPARRQGLSEPPERLMERSHGGPGDGTVSG